MLRRQYMVSLYRCFSVTDQQRGAGETSGRWRRANSPQLTRIFGALVACAAVSVSGGCSEESSTPPMNPTENVEIIRPITLTQDARVPENDPSFESVQVSSDKLVFKYKSAPTIKLVKGHVVAGAKGGGYLRRIESVTATSATMVEVTTKSAYLVEFIRDGAFRVKQDPGATGWKQGETSIGGRTQALGTETGFQVFTPKLYSVSCGVGMSKSTSFTPTFAISIKPDVYVDIKPKVGSLLGELHAAHFIIDAALTVGFELKMASAVSGSCSFDVCEVLSGGNKSLFKYNLPAMAFMVGIAATEDAFS